MIPPLRSLGAVTVGLLLAAAPPVRADDAPHWAFQPLTDPPLPAVTAPDWCRTPLDRFVLARLEADGRTPAPEAARDTLLRRVSFSLAGLPPSAAEADAFRDDPSPQALARRIDRLLESPAYGEHWGRHWLDVVRYADTAGETADYPVPVAWRYRNYVIDSFNADRPYDEFVREQVAGDILALSGPRDRYVDRVTATGFLALSRRFGFDSENYHHLTLQDTIDTLGQTFLGLTLGCARCHAHKYDPVPMTDYYALYGIFESTRYAFPGSEQKQRYRALASLLPPEESGPRWREFEDRITRLTRRLEARKAAPPQVVLRRLEDLDGDFELQAPAAGGSRGVLVPPWVDTGGISVQAEAQSPFTHRLRRGRVGVVLPGGTGPYEMRQALPPGHDGVGPGPVHLRLDFSLAPGTGSPDGRHHLALSDADGRPVVELSLGAAGLRLGSPSAAPPPLAADHWYELRLNLDPGTHRVTGRLWEPGGESPPVIADLRADWDGTVGSIRLFAPAAEPHRPGLRVDNIGFGDPAAAAVAATSAEDDGPDADPESTEKELRRLVGMDGDFELQEDGAVPTTPWGPGPDSVVRIRAASQSPLPPGNASGRLGIHLPNRGPYDGFGQTLPERWTAESAPRIHAGFDFRCADARAGGDGSWRFYIGDGPGRSAAVELFLNARTFFQRSGDARTGVAPLDLGRWYRVRLTLDLAERTYRGTLASDTGETAFHGDLASGWDGVIDYTFVDSYGHLPGVRPALDVDNVALATTPLPDRDPTPADTAGRRERVARLRKAAADRAAEAEAAREELQQLLSEGPYPLAYAVAEGTPRDTRLQLRGEPEKPGDVVPRGFLSALGGGPLPAATRGSGRLELAEWLTRDARALTARVMVNRIWAWHFGRGLVGTPNDFGTRGARPVDPALLDWLASRFIESGWSVKAMHRLILNSAAYRQAGLWTVPPATPVDTDCPALPGGPGRAVPSATPEPPRADALSPFPRRRLTAEEIRDALLLAGGSLHPPPAAGHPFPTPTGWGFTQHGPFGAVYGHEHRSVYLMTQRQRRHPFLALFDGADPNASTPARNTTTVPTQALFFLNDPFVHTQSLRVAERCLADSGTEPEQVRAVHRQVLGRDPDPEETRAAVAFLAAYRGRLGNDPSSVPAALAAWVRVLFASNEFLTVD